MFGSLHLFWGITLETTAEKIICSVVKSCLSILASSTCLLFFSLKKCYVERGQKTLWFHEEKDSASPQT